MDENEIPQPQYKPIKTSAQLGYDQVARILEALKATNANYAWEPLINQTNVERFTFRLIIDSEPVDLYMRLDKFSQRDVMAVFFVIVEI